MLYIEDSYIKEHILDGLFGLEKESLRILGDGTFSHTKHPFENNDFIVKDFCENQTEINTKVYTTVEGAVEELCKNYKKIQKTVRDLPEREYIWPFSNPPYIKNESDIPVASFGGKEVSKNEYRDYLSDKYGRYKMAFSGIHVNFSFSEDMLCHNFSLSGEACYSTYKNSIYLELAKNLAAYGWILTAITAASPLLDSSYVEKGVYGKDVFMGLASVRCSEFGYWNDFVPVFDYQDIESYTDSIKKYVEEGVLKAPSELYYPIRLKPAGENSLDSLRQNGVNHIELRMFDLNPLYEEGIEVKDVLFAQLLMVWLLCRPDHTFTAKHQIQAVQNFKNAAHYDLKTVKIVMPDGIICPVAQAAINMINEMKEFYKKYNINVQEILDFEYSKFEDADNRYAWKIRKMYQDGYVEKGLVLAKELQEKVCKCAC